MPVTRQTVSSSVNRGGLWALGVGISLGVGGPAMADQAPPPEGVVSLSASSHREVSRDVLSITLSVTRDANDAATVQGQLKQVLDAALSEAKKAVQTPALEVRTGAFGLYPRYGSNARINGWQGSAELIVEGKDLQKVAQVAGKLQGMNVTQVVSTLSREMREQYETEIASAAIQQFRTRAQTLARDFGYKDYVLREVSVQAGASGSGGVPVAPMVARADMAQSMAPVPVSPGKATVTVTVTGSVQLKY